MEGIKRLGLLCLLGGWLILGCGSAHKQAAVTKPVTPEKPAAAKQGDPEVDRLIAKAKEHYFVGERELNLGHLEKAKVEFDASLDLLMQYQDQHQPNPKIESVIDELENKIFDHEMAALREGDGFTERPLEPALIDDLKNISTFPPPDQQTKIEVEQELKSLTYDIPVEVNDTVLSFIRIFQNSRRKEFTGGLIRSGRYIDLMRKILREEGVPEDLVYTALIESSFKPNAYSRARAKGFWQFISGTAKRYDLQMNWWVDERSDFEKSTRAAARYLKDLYGMFGDWYLALAGYNAGENKILYGLRNVGPVNFWELARTRYIRQETKNYVPAFLAALIISKDPQKYGFFEEIEKPLEYEKVSVDYVVDLRLVAECAGVSFEEIKMLNPELSRLTTPSKSSSYELNLPTNSKDDFLTEIASIPENKRITWRKHEVREGESLTSIASLYRTTTDSIASANSFDQDATLGVGQKVVIPIGREPMVSLSPKTRYSTSSGYKRYYTIRKGDTLFRIAVKNGTSVDKLCALNGISKKHTLRPGESLLVRFSEPKIVISSAAKNRKIIYKVKKGDTLYQIASNYNTDIDSIKRWNRLRSSRDIYPGDHLTIYAK